MLYHIASILSIYNILFHEKFFNNGIYPAPPQETGELILNPHTINIEKGCRILQTSEWTSCVLSICTYYLNAYLNPLQPHQTIPDDDRGYIAIQSLDLADLDLAEAPHAHDLP